VVRALLAARADIEARNKLHFSPLHCAADQGHEAVVKFLLDAGADLEGLGPGQSTALHLAAQNHHTAVVSALLAAGADSEARNEWTDTPLHCVVRSFIDSTCPVEAYVLGTIKLRTTATGQPKACTYTTRVSDGRRFWVQLRAGGITPMLNPMDNDLVGGILSGVETVVVPAEGDKAERSFEAGFLRVVMRMPQVATMLPLPVYDLGKIKLGTTKTGEPKASTFTTRVSDGRRFWVQLRACDNAPLLNLKEGELVSGVLLGVQTVVVPAKGDKAESRFEAGFLRVVVRMPQVATMLPLPVYVLGTIKLGTTKTGKPKASTFITRVSDGRRFWVQLRAGGNTPMLNPMDNDLVGGILRGVETVVVPAKGDKAEVSFEAGFLRVVTILPPASQYAANATTPEFLSSYLDWKISEEKACKATLASLLAEGTDIESRREDQCTPLLLASYFGAEHAVQMLLAGGANIETVDQGQRSPLHWAALKGHEAVAKLLIEAGADIEARALRQYTPLHWAAQKGHEAVVRALLEAGADPSAESSTGTTALDLAPPGTTVASLLSGNNEQRGSEAL
jgi:predicted Fe-Mo cluster-binding NifX family protein